MNALPLAGYIVQYCIDRKTPISNLQLQKILYFVQLESLKETHFRSALIEDPKFEAWMFGPVIREVYFMYHLSGGMPIYMQPPQAVIEPKENIPEYVQQVVNCAVNRKPWDLVEISHRPNGAWAKVYNEDHFRIIDDLAIVEDARTLTESLI